MACFFASLFILWGIWNAVAVAEVGDGYDELLHDVLCGGSGFGDKHTVVLNGSDYEVTEEHCHVENVTGLSIRGQTNTTIHCTRKSQHASSTAFSFFNMTSLSIENVHFVGCGGILTEEDLDHSANSSLFFFRYGQAAALVCNHCRDLTFKNVTFSNNTGYAFIGVNLHGYSLLDGVRIYGGNDIHSPQVCIYQSEQLICRNRGITLIFMDTNQTVSNSTVLIDNSHFESNFYTGANESIDDDGINIGCARFVFEEFIGKHSMTGYDHFPAVGALTVLYNQKKFMANVTVSRSTFTNNHGACFGAVLILFHTSSSSLSSQVFDECYFTNNSGLVLPYGSGKNYFGDSVTIYMLFDELSDDSQCVTMTRLEFDAIYDIHKDMNTTLQTPAVSITHFPATAGLCTLYMDNIQVTATAKFLYASGVNVRGNLYVMIRDIVMKDSNTYHHDIANLDEGCGLLMFMSVDVMISGTTQETCQFSNLLGPVIISTSSEVALTGEMLFANNRASTWANGAAILLRTGSTLWLSEPLNAVFCNNTAILGGAIASTELLSAEFCVFQYDTQEIHTEENVSSINITLTFRWNSAHLAGNALYINNLYRCSLRLSPKLRQLNVKSVYNQTFVFENSVTNGLLEMSSNPEQLCHCKKEPTNLRRSALTCAGDHSQVEQVVTYPGKTFSLWIVSVDEDFKPVYSYVYSALQDRYGSPVDYSLQSNFNWRLGYGENVARVYGYNCTQLNFSIYTNVLEDSNGTLAMNPIQAVDCLAVPIILKRCPVGFQLVSGSGYCDCSKVLARHGFSCSIDKGTITRPYSDTWLGKMFNSSLESDDDDTIANGTIFDVIGYASNCPTEYCTLNLTIAMDHLNDVCLFNRTGILCGRCVEGMSTVVGGTNCFRCSNFWLFTILLYGAAGILLVIMLFLLRLTVATGTINGIIFYANLYNMNREFYFGYKSTLWLRMFIAFLNLEFGYPLCLYDGMTALVSGYLSFIVPLYLWGIVLVLIFLSRHFQVISRLTSRSAIPVLATLIRLSFSKLLRFIVDGLMFVSLDVEREDGSTTTRSVWYFDGNVDYLKGTHIGLFFLSIFSLVFFLIPYTVFFAGIKWFSRFQFTNRIRPFVDAFCAPYKDRWRFWLGTRLWVLIVIYITYACLRNNPELVVLLQTIILVLLTVFQVAIAPHKDLIIGYLDVFFLSCSIMLNTVALYINGDGRIDIATNVLMAPVVIMFFLIMGYHVYMILCKRKKRRTKKEPKGLHFKDKDGLSETSVLTQDTESAPPATYSALVVNNPHSVLHYRPDELREPLMDSDSD